MKILNSILSILLLCSIGYNFLPKSYIKKNVANKEKVCYNFKYGDTVKITKGFYGSFRGQIMGKLSHKYTDGICVEYYIEIYNYTQKGRYITSGWIDGAYLAIDNSFIIGVPKNK